MIPSGLVPIANHLWQSTLFAGVAGLLTLFLRQNRAQVRYCLWLAASAKFLVPFSLFVLVGGLVGRHAVMVPALSRVPIIVEQVNEPFVAEAFPRPMPASRPPRSASEVVPILIAVWAIGCGALVFSWWLRWRRIRAAVHAGSPAPLVIGVPVLSSASIIEPGVFGVFRPVLLLPNGIADQLAPAELQAILTHELCHVRRRDNLATVIHMVVEAVFWFHPLVWWVGARMMEERERACDEEVLRSGSKPEAYAEGILKICEIYLASPLKCVAGVTGANLKQRIEAIMNNRPTLNLNFARKAVLAIGGTTVFVVPILIGVLNLPVIRGQAVPAGTPKWEAVSIRPCESRSPGARKEGGGPTPGRLNLNCASVVMLIEQAYEFFEDGRMVLASHFPPIDGGPKWIKSDQYAITAKAEGTPRYEMMNGPMLQRILEDRFKLKIHRETKDIPVYALTVAKGGPKLQPSKDGSCIPIEPEVRFPAAPPGQLPRLCGMSHIGAPRGSNLPEDFYAVSLAQFSRSLNLDRPVIDKTGITGQFDIHLEFAFDDTTRGVLPANNPGAVYPEDPTGGTSIFTAVQEQLGLKLEATKGPGAFLVIDHIEQPSEN